MRNILFAAAAALTLVIGAAAPSFAGASSSIEQQSANIQAGGGAYPADVAQYLNRR